MRSEARIVFHLNDRENAENVNRWIRTLTAISRLNYFRAWKDRNWERASPSIDHWPITKQWRRCSYLSYILCRKLSNLFVTSWACTTSETFVLCDFPPYHEEFLEHSVPIQGLGRDRSCEVNLWKFSNNRTNYHSKCLVSLLTIKLCCRQRTLCWKNLPWQRQLSTSISACLGHCIFVWKKMRVTRKQTFRSSPLITYNPA